MKKFIFFLFLNVNVYCLVINESFIENILNKDSNYFKLINDIKQAKRNKKSELNFLYPSITFSASTGNYSLGFIGENAIRYSNFSPNIGLSIGFSLSLQDILNYSYSSADLNYRLKLLSLNNFTSKQINTNLDNFYDIIVAKTDFLFQEDLIKKTEETYKKSQADYNSGKVSQLELIDQEIRFKNALNDFEIKKINYATMILDFFNQIDLDIEYLNYQDLIKNYDFQTDIDIENIDVDQLKVNDLIIQDQDIKNMNMNIKMSELNLKNLKVKLYPDISLRLNFNIGVGWSYPFDLKLREYKEAIFGPNIDLSGSIGLSWNLSNFIPYTSVQNQISTLKENISLQKSNISLKNKEIENILRKILNNLKLLKDKDKVLNEILDLLNQAVTLTIDNYNQGLIAYSKIIDAQDKYLNQINQILKNKKTFISTYLSLAEYI